MPFLHTQWPTFPGTYMLFDASLLAPPPPPRPQMLMLWACHARADADDKQNPPVVVFGGKQWRFKYTTLAKANAATIAKLRAAFVSAEAARQTCVAAGLRFVRWGNIDGLRVAPRQGSSILDVAYCPPLVGDRVGSVVLDYEVADDRTPAQSLAFLRKFSGVAPWVTKFLYTNRVGSGGFTKSGLVGIGRQLVPLFAGISILQDQNERTLRAQANTFGENDHKLFVTVDLSTNDAASMGYVWNVVSQDGMAGVNLWRNGADPASAATLEKVGVFAGWAG